MVSSPPLQPGSFVRLRQARQNVQVGLRSLAFQAPLAEPAAQIWRPIAFRTFFEYLEERRTYPKLRVCRPGLKGQRAGAFKGPRRVKAGPPPGSAGTLGSLQTQTRTGGLPRVMAGPFRFPCLHWSARDTIPATRPEGTKRPPTDATLLPQAVTIPCVLNLEGDNRHDGRHHDGSGQHSHQRKHIFSGAAGGWERKAIQAYAKLSPPAGLGE